MEGAHHNIRYLTIDVACNTCLTLWVTNCTIIYYINLKGGCKVSHGTEDVAQMGH
jgi:hypothetical protein